MAKRTLLEECLHVAEILNKDDRYRMISESIRGTWGSFEDESWSGMGRREGRDILCRQIVSECLDEPVGLCEDACTSVDKDEVYRLIRSGLQSVVMESVIELEAFYKVCMAIHGRDKEEEEEEPEEEQHGCSLAAKQGCSGSSSGSHSHCRYQLHHNHNDDILPETPGQDIWRPLPMEENTTNKKKNTSKEREEEESHGEQKKRGQDEAKMMADEMTRIVDEYFGYKSLVVHLVDLAGFLKEEE